MCENSVHGKSSTKAQREALDREIEDLLIQQYSARQVGETLAAKYDRNQHYITKRAQRVVKRWFEEGALERQTRKDQMRETLRGHYRWCRDKNQHMAATRTLDLLCKLDGLMAPVMIEATIQDDNARRTRLEFLLGGFGGAGQAPDAMEQAADDVAGGGGIN